MCNPVFFSFVILTKDSVKLFANANAFALELKELLRGDGVELLPYDSFYEALKTICGPVLLDRETCSELILQSLQKDTKIMNDYSPVMKRKAVKNTVEMKGVHSAHLKDGVAMCKFLYWLKTNAAKAAETKSGMGITEISAAEKLHEFRAEQDLFMGDSFEAIVGYGPHAAIVHYCATPESDEYSLNAKQPRNPKSIPQNAPVLVSLLLKMLASATGIHELAAIAPPRNMIQNIDGGLKIASVSTRTLTITIAT